jgi:ABC-2 type transport system permease protein
MFPVLLILIFGAIFSGTDDMSYDIVIQDLDNSDYSKGLIDVFEEIPIINVIKIEQNNDISIYMQDEDKSVGLQIPSDFSDKLQKSFIDENITVDLTFYQDPSEQTTTSVIRNIVTSTLYEYNIGISQGTKLIGLYEVSILSEDFDFIDYFVPGMIGFTIMTSMIYGSIERNTKYRKDGILRKLLTMPVTRADWIISKMLFMLVLSFISTFVIMFVGILVWELNIKINIYFFIIVVSTSFMFSGMGMIISRFVKDEEIADMAGGAITFPMMFLAGTFFPLDQMPDFLQTVAQVLPLYYVNEGLRNAMIYNDIDKTLFFTAFVLAFALIFFIAGVLLTKWKED